MSNLQDRIEAFVKLGKFLNQFSSYNAKKDAEVYHNDLFFSLFKSQIKLAQEQNNWFSEDNIYFAISQWADLLKKEKLDNWTNNYNFNENSSSKTVAVVMAGNIPLVGFHDFLSVIISGHSIIVKQSTNDKHLLPLISKYLEHVEPSLKGSVFFTTDKLENFDAVIATGSNNTARYFEYYFRKKPAIIRKNRNSVAVLTGDETEEQLTALGEDIFRYYGLGCRNVSKLLVPENYNFDTFFKAIYPFNNIMNSQKYANNYDYNKAVYLMSQFELLENGFLMLKEDENYGSPIATIFYEKYTNKEHLNKLLANAEDKIQCVVSQGIFENEVSFGKTQQPQLQDYADSVDTIEFLLKI